MVTHYLRDYFYTYIISNLREKEFLKTFFIAVSGRQKDVSEVSKKFFKVCFPWEETQTYSNEELTKLYYEMIENKKTENSNTQ